MFSPYGYISGFNWSQSGLMSGSSVPGYPSQQLWGDFPCFSNPPQSYSSYGFSPYFQPPPVYYARSILPGGYPITSIGFRVSETKPDEIYQGVGLMTSTMNPAEVNTLKRSLDLVSYTADGQKIIQALSRGGVVMEKDEAGLQKNAIAQGGQTTITFGNEYLRYLTK